LVKGCGCWDASINTPESGTDWREKERAGRERERERGEEEEGGKNREDYRNKGLKREREMGEEGRGGNVLHGTTRSSRTQTKD